MIFEKRFQLNNEGQQLFNEDKQEAGLEKMTQAVNLFPEDASFLLVRGQAYLDMERFGEACDDLIKGQRIALLSIYDSILPLICR